MKTDIVLSEGRNKLLCGGEISLLQSVKLHGLRPNFSLAARESGFAVSTIWDAWRSLEKKCDIEVVLIFKPKLFAEGKNFQDHNFHAPSASNSFYECPDCGFTLEGNFSDAEGNDLTAHDCREVKF